MGIKSLIEKVYFNNAPLSAREYYDSRKIFVYEGATARAIFVLSTGAFFAGFAKYLGASDQLNGILGGIPILAGVMQMFSPMLFEKLESRKFAVVISFLFHRLLLGLMLFIPLFVVNRHFSLLVVAIVYLVSFMLMSFGIPPVSGMLIDLTPENIRGKYFGIRESYIFAAATIVSLIMGRVLDIFKRNSLEYSGFLLLAVFLLALTLVNFFIFSSVKEPPIKKYKVAPNLRSIITIPLMDKKFRKIIVLFFLWNMGLQIGFPFIAVYMVTGLKLQYAYIMLMGAISALLYVITVRIWGKIAQKRGWVFTTKCSIALLAVTHAGWFLVNPQTLFLMVPVVHVLGGASWAGINISIFNVPFSFTPEEGRTIYIGFNAALGGLVGFLSILGGSALLGVFEYVNISFMGIAVGGMQLLFAVSSLILGICAAYIHNFIKADGKNV